MSIFSGLENLGLGNLKEMEVYSSEKEVNKGAVSKDNKQGAAEVSVTEADILFDKTFNCPVCGKEFKSKTVKTGKVKLVSADTDLRPKYLMVDSLKYDAIVCPHCGFAALNRFFNYMTSNQAKLIKEQVSNNFKGIREDSETYSYDDAIMRHKLALVCTIVKKGKTSERAYTCLKLAWLMRGKREELLQDAVNAANVIKNLEEEEGELLKNAYEGFLSAFSKELFPMCGMDENTTTYLVADLARRCGKYEESSRWISKVLTARDANERIKSKAREIKELIKEGL